MNIKSILPVLFSGFIMNCSVNKISASKASKNVAVNEDNYKKSINENKIYLSENENKFLKEYNMNITFKGISEDSQCPEDVQCVWAGVAVANIELMGTYTRPSTFLLATSNIPAKGYVKTAIFNGYVIILTEVIKNKNTGKYKIGLTIEKSVEATSDTKNNSTTK